MKDGTNNKLVQEAKLGKEVDKQLDKAVQHVESLIDLPITDSCNFLETRSVGELRGLRTLIEQKLMEVDKVGATMMDSKLVLKSDEEKKQFGGVFGISQRIISLIGVTDYFILKKQGKVTNG